jgi:hypothetical protein
MLRGAFDSAGDSTPTELRESYDELLAETVRAVGVDEIAATSDIDRQRLSALVDGESPALTLEEATTILAADENRPDAETLAAEASDILLMGMSLAVLDVERLSAGVDREMGPKEIQQKAEGRQPMPLDEYALLHSYIEGEQ